MTGLILRRMDEMTDEELEGLLSLLNLHRVTAKALCMAFFHDEEASLKQALAL